jgi:hypothetical protein
VLHLPYSGEAPPHAATDRTAAVGSGGEGEQTRPPVLQAAHALCRTPSRAAPASSTLPLAAGRRRVGTRPDPPPACLRRPEQHKKGSAVAALRRPQPPLRRGRRKGGRGGWRVELRRCLPCQSGCAVGASSSDGVAERAGGRGARARDWCRPESPARERHGTRGSPVFNTFQ